LIKKILDIYLFKIQIFWKNNISQKESMHLDQFFLFSSQEKEKGCCYLIGLPFVDMTLKDCLINRSDLSRIVTHTYVEISSLDCVRDRFNSFANGRY
jgi:hypothetical protein